MNESATTINKKPSSLGVVKANTEICYKAHLGMYIVAYLSKFCTAKMARKDIYYVQKKRRNG